MKRNTERARTVLVIMYAAFLVAISFLSEARGREMADLNARPEGTIVQPSSPTVWPPVSRANGREAPGQQSEQITDANWRQHPKIAAIRKIVTTIDAGLKNRAFKTAEFNCGERQLCCFFTLGRIARNSTGGVVWYERYNQGTDAEGNYRSFDDFHYYDSAGRLRFVLNKVYAANGSREEFRVYFDEGGKPIWQNRKKLRGPGYRLSTPPDLEELMKLDPAKQFEEEKLGEGCKLIKPKPKR